MRLLTVQKDIGLPWLPGLSSIILSLFIIIVQSELEHEHISILKLLLFILKWKCDSGMFSITALILKSMHSCKLNAHDKFRLLFFFFYFKCYICFWHFSWSSKSISVVFIFHIFKEQKFMNFSGYCFCILFPLKHFFSGYCSLLEFVK